MSGVSDIKQQLEQLGARPVPAPSEAFAEGLLARLLDGRPTSVAPDGDGVGTASPTAEPLVVDFAARRRSRAVATRAAAAVSIAAAAAGVLGAYSLIDSDGSSTAVVAQAQLASGSGDAHFDVGDDGVLRPTSGAATMSDGDAEMTCTHDMVFSDVRAFAYTCAKGEKVVVTIADNAIVGSTATPTAPVPKTLTLDAVEAVRDNNEKVLSWSWKPYDGKRFRSYDLVRRDGDTKTPYDPDEPHETVVSLTDSTMAGYRESAPLTHTATYQLLVLAEDGSTVLAKSNLVVVKVASR